MQREKPGSRMGFIMLSAGCAQSPAERHRRRYAVPIIIAVIYIYGIATFNWN